LSSRINKCMVQECRYNRDFECHASGVEVRSQQDAVTSGVSASSHTLCETFAPREATPADAEDLTFS